MKALDIEDENKLKDGRAGHFEVKSRSGEMEREQRYWSGTKLEEKRGEER